MDYDLAILGAGWAGFNAALRAKAAGLKVVLIEKERLGGTCLNHGCIPTKVLLQTAKVYSLTKKAPIFGVQAPNPQLDYRAALGRTDKILQQLGQGMQSLLKGVDFIPACAKITSSNTIEAGSKKIEAKFILIASGSKPAQLQNLKFDGKKIISSDQALALKEVPQSLLIVGGGVIGCEFATLFSSLGCKVTLVELMPQLLPGIDKDTSKRLEGIFKKKGVKVSTGTDITGVDLASYDYVLLAVGRTPNTVDFGLEAVGIKKDGARIVVDEYLKTSVANIYAAGDCTGGIMLAHYAAYQGEIAAENIANPSRPLKADSSCIPNCIFTDPQIAGVGLTEEEAKNRGIEHQIHSFDFKACGMARILEETDGFIKIISVKKTEEIIGASIIGPQATELICLFAVTIRSRLKTRDIKNTIFAHPTLSESIAIALKENHGI